MQRLKDKLLVFRVSEGKDAGAFEQLYDFYKRKIYQFTHFRVSNYEDAEDIASQVFLKAWEYLTDKNIKRVQNFQAFIYQLTRNLIIDYYRKQGRIPQNIDLEELDEESEIEDPRSLLFLNQLYKAEDRACLNKCLEQIKDEYKEVIILRYLHEIEIEEIAEIIGKTQGNVRVLIHRGLKALKPIILSEYESKRTSSIDQSTQEPEK